MYASLGSAGLPELDALVDGGLELGDERLEALLLIVAQVAQVEHLLRACMRNPRSTLLLYACLDNACDI